MIAFVQHLQQKYISRHCFNEGYRYCSNKTIKGWIWQRDLDDNDFDCVLCKTLNQHDALEVNQIFFLWLFSYHFLFCGRAHYPTLLLSVNVQFEEFTENLRQIQISILWFDEQACLTYQTTFYITSACVVEPIAKHLFAFVKKYT